MHASTDADLVERFLLVAYFAGLLFYDLIMGFWAGSKGSNKYVSVHLLRFL